jgi:membrane protease YdiL (CAAX protease family)
MGPVGAKTTPALRSQWGCGPTHGKEPKPGEAGHAPCVCALQDESVSTSPGATLCDMRQSFIAARHARGVVAILCLLAAMFGLRGSYELARRCLFESGTRQPGFWWKLEALGLVCQLVTALAALAALRQSSRTQHSQALMTRWFGSHGLKGLALGAILSVPLAVLLASFGTIEFPASLSPEALPHFISAVLVHPAAEEIIFRGVLFTMLWRRAHLPVSVALAISSLVFGASHVRLVNWGESASITLALLKTVGGAALCWLYWVRRRDLCLPIGLHASINAWISVYVREAPMPEEQFGLLVELCTMTTLAVSVIVVSWSARTNERRNQCTP